MSDEITANETFAGTSVEIDAGGNYSIDTHEARSAGDIHLHLKPDASLTIKLGDSVALRLESIGGWTRIELGEHADQRLVLGDRLLAFLSDFIQQKFDAHTHNTPSGHPTTPPLPAFTGTQVTEELLSDVVFAKKS